MTGTGESGATDVAVVDSESGDDVRLNDGTEEARVSTDDDLCGEGDDDL